MKIKSYQHAKSSDVCTSLISLAFGVKVAAESDDIYPPSVCHNCFRILQKIKEAKQTRVTYKTALSLSGWTPHNDNENNPCPVCHNVSRHKKIKSQGRPCKDDITHLGRNIMREVNAINSPQFSDLPLALSLFLTTPALQDLLCQHCHSVPNQPVEILPCHHLLCVACIGRITETDILKCTCNQTEVTAENLSIPHPVVLKLLKSLLLKCPLLCGQIIEFQNLSKHLTLAAWMLPSHPSIASQ